MKQVRIPSRIDAPLHFLLWSTDEFAPLALSIFAGIMSDHLTLCLIAGALAMHGYRQFRDGRPDGFLWHWLYWWGFVPARGRSMPNPYIVRFLP